MPERRLQRSYQYQVYRKRQKKRKKRLTVQEQKFYCRACEKPIDSKSDLAVVGRSFYTYHNRCFENIKHKDIYAFYSGYKINGWFPWVFLIVLNLMLWVTYYLFNAPFQEVLIFSIFLFSMTLVFRGISYFFYERHYN